MSPSLICKTSPTIPSFFPFPSPSPFFLPNVSVPPRSCACLPLPHMLHFTRITLSALWFEIHLQAAAAAAAKLLQSCPTLCNPIDSSPPGYPVPGILQARTLEWVAISFSNVWKWKVKGKSLSHFRLFATPWTAAYQTPPSMGFSRQEYWSGLPLPSPIIT